MKKTRTVKMPLNALASLGVTKTSGRRGLRQLEAAGLVSVVRSAKRAADVTILETNPECKVE